MKMIPVPKEPGEVQDLLNRGYDRHSINQRYKADMDEIRKEYGLMALLKGNANVVYCDDVCDEPNPDGIGWKLYIRMELLTPLTKALADPYSEAQVVKVGMDLCNALAACKRKNIIHRDIKPANIMVAEDGNYKLGDFGVAKTLEGTSGGTKTGTYNFMAPEVYNNRPYGQSVDIYSLGMVLYWMLNRRCSPFLPLPPTVPTASQMESAKERRFGGEPLPPPVNGSQALKQIVLRACAFDPAQRYDTPEALYAALAALPPVKYEEPEEPYMPCGPGTSWEDLRRRPNWEPKPYCGNAWEGEYDPTQGSVYGGGGTQGGTVGGTVGGSGNGSDIGPFDIRGQLQVTAQELASGCVKSFTTGTGKKINVTVKAGTAAGTVLRLTGAGRENAATGAKGDAYVAVILQENSQRDIWEDNTSSGKKDYVFYVSAEEAKKGGSFALAEYNMRLVVTPNSNNGAPVTVTRGGESYEATLKISDATYKLRPQTPWEEMPQSLLEVYRTKKSIGFGLSLVLFLPLVIVSCMIGMALPFIGFPALFLSFYLPVWSWRVTSNSSKADMEIARRKRYERECFSKKGEESSDGSGLTPADMKVIHDHLTAGNKLLALKVYREITGADLAEAKAAIEKIANQKGSE